MNIRTLTFTLSMALGALFTAKAVPAYPGPLTMTQPDGTQIEVRLYGDERGHYYTTLNGQMLLSTESGFRIATLDSNGEMAPGDLYTPGMRFSISPADNARLIEMAKARIAKAKPRHPYADKPVGQRTASSNGMTNPPNPVPGLFPGSDFPTIGSPKVLVLLVEYSDVKFSSQSAPETLRQQITMRNYTERGFTGSVLDYYATASMEQFTPQFDVIGPIRLPGTQAYYGAHDPMGGSDIRPREMVIDACNIASSQTDLSQYDNNHDGYVDNVYVIYAGRGEASGGGDNTIWPHSWSIPDNMSPTYNGVKLGSYACGNELTIVNGSVGLDAIGTFCHEFGHVIGLPDLYSSGYNANNHPGGWALMASGSYTNNSKTPPTLSAWERAALGWLKPTVLEVSGDYVLKASLLTSNQAYLIPTKKANEYFTLENRQPFNNDWDHHLPSWGMLVWHIDYNPQIWNYNIVNDDEEHQYANIVEAHGNDLVNVSPMEVCFPTFGHNAFTEKTTPALKAWDGSLTDVTLTSITENEDDSSPSFGDIYLKAVSRSGYDAVQTLEDDNGLSIAVSGRDITVNGSAPAFTVLTPDGRIVANSAVANTVSLPAAGLYIVRSENKSAKILIR